MSLMSKLLISTTLSASVLLANPMPDNKLLVNYAKKSLVKNPEAKLKGVTVIESKTDIALPGWSILLTVLNVEYRGKEMKAPETMFVKDGLVTGHLVDMKTGVDYRDTIKPSVPESYYNDEHRLFGNKDAKHKILIFSDPQCPYCQDIVPDIFKASRENPSQMAVYYYHLPLLRIHPVSDVLTRVMHVAHHEGKPEIADKIYSLKIDPRETNTTKILSAVKKHSGYDVSQEKIDAQSVKDAIKADMDDAGKMMVGGTPTIYIDGKWDRSRSGYKKFIK